MKYTIDTNKTLADIGKIVGYLAIGAAGIFAGVKLTQKVYNAKLEESISAAAKKTIESEAIQDILKKTAVEAAGKISSEDVNQAVESAAKIAADNAMPKAAKSIIEEVGKTEIKSAIDDGLKDYDIRKELLGAVSDAAEDYCNRRGESIISNKVGKVIDDKVGAIGSFAKTVSAFKSVI